MLLPSYQEPALSECLPQGWQPQSVLDETASPGCSKGVSERQWAVVRIGYLLCCLQWLSLLVLLLQLHKNSNADTDPESGEALTNLGKHFWEPQGQTEGKIIWNSFCGLKGHGKPVTQRQKNHDAQKARMQSLKCFRLNAKGVCKCELAMEYWARYQTWELRGSGQRLDM